MAYCVSTMSSAPVIEVSGVRSSWETMETNSSLRCSSCFSEVMSRSTTTTPTNEPTPSITGEMIECSTRSPTRTSSRIGSAPGAARIRSNG